jgi:leucyl/phenylalanyl-tRNA--protein transferase
VRRRLGIDGFQLSLNRSFDAVLSGCAGRPDTWISAELARIYRHLHRAGWAHSVEVWEGGELAAGLLGIGIGSCWIGESMVHHRDNAGNVMLVRLVEALREGGFSLFDVQLSNPHLERFGCREIGHTTYTALLQQARSRPTILRLGKSVVHCGGWMRE